MPLCDLCGATYNIGDEDSHECHPEVARRYRDAQALEAMAELGSPQKVADTLAKWAVDPHRDAPDIDRPEEWEASWPRRRAHAQWRREREG